MFSPEKIAQLRADTPGTISRIHLNNAGAALMPKPVINAIQDHISLEAHIGGYEAAAAVQDAVKGFYEQMALFLNTQPANIAYTTNATDSYNRALSSIVFQKGDVILTTNNDYASNQIAFLQLVKRHGVNVIRITDLPTGGIDVESAEELIKKHKPKLVAVTHVPTNSGLVQDIISVGQFCRDHGCIYLVDACQSAGQMSLDVQLIQCDFLSATFRKFIRGPRGAGFLYVSDRILKLQLEPAFLDLFSAVWTQKDQYEMIESAKRFELWERSFALVLGAKASIEYALDLGLPAIETRVKHLANLCREKLEGLPRVKLLDEGKEKCGIVTCHISGIEPRFLTTSLQKARINTSNTSIEAARIDFTEKGVKWALRVSPHYYNTEAEIDLLKATLASILDNG